MDTVFWELPSSTDQYVLPAPELDELLLEILRMGCNVTALAQDSEGSIDRSRYPWHHLQKNVCEGYYGKCGSRIDVKWRPLPEDTGQFLCRDCNEEMEDYYKTQYEEYLNTRS